MIQRHFSIICFQNGKRWRINDLLHTQRLTNRLCQSCLTGAYIDVVPVPKDLTTKVLQKKYLGIESDIIKQQRVRNKNNDFSTEISYAKRTEKKEIEEIMDDVRENDQCLFFVGVTIILMAESKKELESVCETVETIGKRNSCTIVDCQHFFRQIFLGYFSDIVQAFDTLRKNVCGDDYTSLHNPIVLSSVLPAYGMFHSIQILFL